MSISSYLPSAKLVSIVLSLALSIGLVFAADALTHRSTPVATVAVDTNSQSNIDADWQTALASIQAQTASSTFPAPDPDFVNTLLQAAQTSNVTDTVGKTILINLNNAQSQGMGDDIPTQDQIVAAAAQQLKDQRASPHIYTTADLTVVPASNTSLRAYGNGVMSVLSATSSASESATLLSIDLAIEGGDKNQGEKLAAIGSAYAALARALITVPVPQTLVPLHLQVLNDYSSISATYTDMQTVSDDPLRALEGLQTYESLLDEEARVFTNIAQELSKDGILFTKDEPGSAWSTFVSP